MGNHFLKMSSLKSVQMNTFGTHIGVKGGVEGGHCSQRGILARREWEPPIYANAKQQNPLPDKKGKKRKRP